MTDNTGPNIPVWVLVPIFGLVFCVGGTVATCVGGVAERHEVAQRSPQLTRPEAAAAPSKPSAVVSQHTPKVSGPGPLVDTGAIPTEADSMVATVHVKVQEKKVDGSTWDGAGGAMPDLAICVTTSVGKKCYPPNQHDPSLPRGSECWGSLTCTFSDVFVGDDRAVHVEVLDADLAKNDAIGVGDCTVGSECVLGLASVVIKRQ